MAEPENAKTLQEHYPQVREQIKKRWGDQITDADLDEISGQRAELCHLLEAKCHLSAERAKKEIDTILQEIEARRLY